MEDAREQLQAEQAKVATMQQLGANRAAEAQAECERLRVEMAAQGAELAVLQDRAEQAERELQAQQASKKDLEQQLAEELGRAAEFSSKLETHQKRSGRALKQQAAEAAGLRTQLKNNSNLSLT